MIQFRALGEVAALVDGERLALGGQRQRRLLAMLLIHRNTTVSTDRLVEAVFAGEPTDAAATTMRSYIARIRRVVGGHDPLVAVVTQAPGYRLDVPDELFDVALFEAAVAEAERCLARGDPESARRAAIDAIDRWAGDPYTEFDDEMWALPEAQRLRELQLVAADRRIEADLAVGRAREAVPEIERLVREHPMREGFRAHLMTALYRSGRQADALAAYQQYRTELAEELGLEPSPSLADLERRILNHDPALAEPEGGRSLHGYRIGERLGSGTDGTLYAARLPGVDRQLVLRSFRADTADRPGFVRGFESDAHRLAALRHPAIVPVHDYWRGPHEAYLATARLSGGTLADRLRSGPLTNRELSTLVERVGGALVSAAAVGLTHGRLSPSNVLFDHDGAAFVTDFTLGPDERPSPAADVAALASLIERSTASTALREHLARVTASAATTIGELVAGVLAQLDAGRAAPANPYKGLEAFDEVDAADFHGRDGLVDDIVKRFYAAGSRSRLVLVVGGSGTGKSSVVRAGVLPRLRGGDVPGSEDWLITTVTPGTNPFQRLADALTRVSVDRTVEARDLELPGGIDACVGRLAGSSVVLVVLDQFEELFTLAEAPVQRRFLDELATALTSASPRLRVVATLRADYFDRPLAVASFGSLVNECTVTVPAMTPSELEAAIVEPARRAGLEVEGPVVAELVAAVLDDAAALPALQFTLRELAERSDGRMTLAAYRQLGGVAGAVAVRAEALYQAAPPDERAMLRTLFERLVVVGDGEATRRRVRIADVTGSDRGGPGIDAVIERWATARLLTLDRDPRTRVPTVDVAHEALVREWPRLARWIAEDRAAIATIARIETASQSWVEADRDEGLLARGVALQAALDVAANRPLELTPLEREFVEASRAATEAAQAEQQAQLQRQRRSNRRLRWQLAALACVLVLALVVGLVAIDQRRVADSARRTASVRELASAADANLDIDPERSMLLALRAVELAREGGTDALPDALTALHRAVMESRVVRRIDAGGIVAWSPTGEYLVSEGEENTGTIDLRDPASGASIRSWQGDPIDINDVAFSPDGTMLATAGDSGLLQVWDPDTGRLRFAFQVDDGGAVWGPSFSGDGRRLAASWVSQGVVRVFDTTDGTLIGEGNAPWVFATSLDHDGERIAVPAEEGDRAYVADVSTGAVQVTLEAPGAGYMRIVRFSPDGRSIAAGAEDGVVRVWDAETGARRFHVDGGSGGYNALTWSADGRRLAAGSIDGTAYVWDVRDGEARRLAALSAEDTQHGVQGVAFSPDGSLLATGDIAIASVIVWDLDPLGSREWATVQVGEYSPIAVVGDRVLATADDGHVWSYSMDDGAGTPLAPTPPGVEHLAVTPDGSVLATATFLPRARVRLWDGTSGAELTSFRPADFYDHVTSLAWSPDGRYLAVTGVDDDSSGIVVVDRNGEVIARFREDPGAVIHESAFSPDGTTIAIPRTPRRQTGDEQGVWLWDWRSGQTTGLLDANVIDVDWDPDGERLVTIAELASRVEVWDARTLERISAFVGTSVFSDVHFSPDGSHVVTAGTDGGVSVWGLETGAPMRLRGHVAYANAAVYSADGRRLVSVDSDGVMRIWAIDVGDLVAIAEARLTRDFSDVECRRFLHGDSC